MSKPTRSSSRRSGSRIFGLIAAAATLLLTAHPAFAQSRLLDDARSAGTVGERYDGIAVLRAGASDQVRQTVDGVNAQRLAIYRQRAAAESISIEAVGTIYAKQIFQNAPPGTWFLSMAGQWVRK